MAMNIDNDDKDEEIRYKAVPPGEEAEDAGVKAMLYYKRDASIESENFRVLVELTGTESNNCNDRPGLDIVMVLDVSGSMRGVRLSDLKRASKFLIKKLSPIDHLSVVTFSKRAELQCQLKAMTEDGQEKIEKIINELVAGGGTNITAGLELAVKVMKDRRFKEGRLAAIMFMSDGEATVGGDGSGVDFGEVPVHTFGLGLQYNPKALADMARRSGGTFSASDVENPSTSSLSRAFALCLGGLLSVVATDLKVFITSRDRSTINNVSAGNYAQTRDDARGSVTILLGNLYGKEIRKVLVDVVLHAIDKPLGANILQFAYSYKKLKREVENVCPPSAITVARRLNPSREENIEVRNEVARQDTAVKIKEALKLADDNLWEDAKSMLDEAVKGLEGSDLDQTNPLVVGLFAEVKQLKSLMETPDIYAKLGRAFGYASELSHALQRASAGGDLGQPGLFATPAMNQAVDQAIHYEANPEAYKVPTSGDDKLERIVEGKEKEAMERKQLEYRKERVIDEKVAKKKEKQEMREKASKPLTYLENLAKGLNAIKKIVNCPSSSNMVKE